MENGDQIIPLLDQVDHLTNDVHALGQRASAEAVDAAKRIVLPGMVRAIWLLSITVTVASIVAALAFIVVPIVTINQQARIAIVEEAKTAAEANLEERVEQVAGERLRSCEAKSAAATARSEQVTALAWAVAIRGRDANTDAYVRAVTGLDSFDRSVIVRLSQIDNRSGAKSVIGAVLSASPSTQRQIYEMLTTQGLVK